MAMNWGAALGAAVTTGLNTYERLGEEELREMQRQQLRKDIAEKEALDAAWRQTQGRVGQQDEYGQAIKAGAGVGTEQAQMLSTQGALPGNTAEDQAFEKASAESAVGAMRENAAYNKAGNTGYAAPAEGERAPQAALPTLKPTEYTAKQGMQDYVKAAGQISRKGTLEALQMKGVMRESDIQDKFDTERQKLDDTLAMIHGTGESQGLKGLAEAANKEGLKVKFVEGKNGVGSRIQVLGPKGDVLQTVSDVNSATEKLSEAAMQQFYTKAMSLLGDPSKVIAALQGERTLKAKEAVIPSEIAKNYGAASYYSSGGKGGSGGKYTPFSEGVSYDQKTGKWYDITGAQITDAAQIEKIKKAGTSAQTWKSTAGNPDIQENPQGQQREWNPKTKQYEVRGEVNPVVAALTNPNLGANKPAAAKQALPVKPEYAEYNPSAYNHWLEAAKKGDTMGKALLAGWIEQGDLTAGQRAEASKYAK